MEFRSIPTKIDAEQWFPGKEVPGVYGWKGDGEWIEIHCHEGYYRSPGPFVVTIHRQVTPIESGDWIIREPDGIHYYPCKPDIFVRKYEKIPGGREVIEI